MSDQKILPKDRRKNIRSTRLLPYSVAILSVLIALGLTLMLGSLLRPTPLQLFFIAVIVSAWYGGLGPGLLATILSTLLSSYFFINPLYSLGSVNLGAIVRLSIFLIASGLISSLTQSRRRALNKAQEALQILQEVMEREQAAKEQLETVLSSINDGVYVLDHDWRFTYVNDRYCKMMGMERSAILDQNVWELFPAVIGTEADVQFRRAIREQTPLQFDYFYSPWNSWHDHRIYPSSSGLTVFLADITERKEIEAALQQSNDRFYAAMRAVEGIVFEWNLQTQTVYRSEGLFQLVGVRAEDALPTSQWWAERVHPDDLKRLEAAFVSIIVSRDRYEGEYRVRHEAGHWVDVWERGYLQRNSQGELIGVVGFTTDISDRKRAEEALRESEKRFRTLADNMSQLAWMTDETGWIFWYNQRWFEYTGTTLEEMQGWGWQQVHHPDHVERVVAHFRHSLETGESWEDTFPLRGQDGIYRWFLSRALPIKDPEGRILRWFGTNTDITERRQNQLQLQEQAQQLMQLNTELRQTTEILAKRNQELDRFVYVVSHDLKAPLRAIANLSQWLEDDLAGQLPEENQQQMELLRQRVHRLEDFIDGLLAYSRVGRTQVAEETVSISELLTEILDSLAPPVSFTIKVQPSRPSVVTKKLLLTQVFSNLISNAIKHHHRLDGQIILSAAEKGDGYEFMICDDGPGIAPEHHEKIFGIFQTLKVSNTKDSTGIGLSIVKKILETEGGAIVLESELGMGTTFRFTWPKQPKIIIDEMANSSQT